MKRIALLTVALVTLCCASSALGITVFSNPYDPNSTVAHSSIYYLPQDELIHQCFADYLWEDQFYMTDFHWWGLPYGDVEGFTFQVWSHDDASGLPSGLLYEEYFAGDAGETYVDGNQGGVYEYGIDLGTAFMPAGPGPVWFSVFAHSSDNWFWAEGDGTVFNEDWQHQNMDTPSDYWDHPATLGGTDFAYEITSVDPIPEPATIALLSLGGLLLRKRR